MLKLPKNLTKYLGPVIFLESDLTAKAEIGICTGLAWTSVGGELLKVEVLATLTVKVVWY